MSTPVSEPMKIVITGAAGALASGIRPYLRKQHELVLLDRRAPAEKPTINESWIAGDVLNDQVMRKALQGADALLHFACVHGYTISFEQTLDVNYRGTICAYEAALSGGVKRLVNISSNHGWGFRKPVETPIERDAASLADGWYGISKLWGEAVTGFYAQAHGLSATSLRLGHANDHVPTAREGHMWVSYRDLAALIDLVLARNEPGHQAYWATVDCDLPYFDNAATLALGWQPQDTPMTPRNAGGDLGPQDDIGGAFARANRKSPS